jgi:uncharacterized protein YkwD
MPSPVLRRAVGATLLVGAAIGTTLVAAVPASAQTATERRMQLVVLQHLNAERRAHHLPALKLSSQLDASARAHSVLMEQRNALSHELPHERGFASRISATGYRWLAVAENIAWTSRTSSAGIASLQHAMYAEKAPNDGHRVNILGKSYRQVGISVVYDTKHHRFWLTEDFGRSR